MKKNINSTLPVSGMARENFNHLLDEKTFTFQKNGALQTDEDTIGLTNEHSNLLCSRFLPGYKVIGHKYDGLKKRVIFFLTNPETGKSQIGQIKFNTEIQEVADIERQCNCDFEMVLSEPLEIQEQTPHCNYEPIVTDDCNTCLNFSIDYPIHNIEIRHEQSGSIMYWTDGKNPFRYIQLDELEQYTLKDIPCKTESEEVCFDCDKLRVFPLFSRPYLKATALETGGNIKRGNYIYKIAYCDATGEELTDYFDGTGRVTIFDPSENILDQPQYADPTKYSIRLDVSDLDTRYTHYVIAVIYFNGMSGGEYQGYKLNPTPTTVNTVIHTSNNNLKTISLEKINAVRPIYETVDGIATSNNYLIPYGLKQKRMWNMQPIANLLGFFLKWQTVMAKEGLYENGVNDANYGSYMRDEVYPYAIRFGTDDGYISPLTPLIARPPRPEEVEEIPSNNKDLRSVNESQNCVDLGRTKRYQLYNTATVDAVTDCTPAKVTGKTKEMDVEELSKFTVHEIPKGELKINPNGEFEDFVEWLNENVEYVSDVKTQTGDNAHALLSEIINVKYVDTHKPPKVPFGISEEEDYPAGTCRPLQLDEDFESTVLAKGIENPVYEKVPKSLDDYEISTTTDCNFYHLDKNKPVKDDNEQEDELVVNRETQPVKTKFPTNVRNIIEGYNNCNNTVPITDMTGAIPVSFSTYYRPTFNRISGVKYTEQRMPRKAQIIDALLELSEREKRIIEEGKFLPPFFSENDAEYIDKESGYHEKLHKNVIFFSIEKSEYSDLTIFEVAKGIECCEPDNATSSSTKVRYHLYTECDKVLESGLIDTEEGKLFILENKDIKGEMVYLALDTPLEMRRARSSSYHYGEFSFEHDVMVLTSNKLCFKVVSRNQEYTHVTVKHDGITFQKTERYKTTCKYLVPNLDNCDPQTYKQGDFGYVESTEIYPDNHELYDSSFLKINDSIINKLEGLATSHQMDRFKEAYVDGTDEYGNYIWKRDTKGKPLIDFTCRNIRHYKFPDNGVSPMMSELPLTPFGETIIYPIGVSLSPDIINAFLDVAVDNKLLSQEERDSITYFELFRGNRNESNKSVIYKGIANDMYKDPTDKNTYFRNFPYNTLGENKLLHDERGLTVKHPFDSTKNNRFSFIAPEIYLDKRITATEVHIEGYMYGSSVGGFHTVNNHSKWVILGEAAKKQANRLATLEVTFEITLTLIQMTAPIVGQSWFIVGATGTGGNLLGKVAALAMIGVYGERAISKALYKQKRYYDQWIRSFKDLGSPINFAHYFLSPKGFYNRLSPNKEEGNKVRAIVKSVQLKPGVPTTNEEGTYIRINNREREDSLYLSFGQKYHLEYPDEYVAYDNADMSPNNSSRYISSDVRCNSKQSDTRRIASPYFSLKRYVPNQYGNIYNINWIRIPNKGSLEPNQKCNTLFGGDVRITRTDLKNKVPLFITTAVGLANRLPFMYSEYYNIARPAFYVDYETGTEGKGTYRGLPTQETKSQMDCFKDRGHYVSSPAKFYLFYYGIPYFMVESEINNHYRVAGKEPHENFASNGIDVEQWTQQDNVNIDRPNVFRYNKVYDMYSRVSEYQTLNADYKKSRADRMLYFPNDAIISDQDNNEMSYVNPWLRYKPFNRTHFDTDYGKLITLKGLESNTVLCLFENQAAIFNAVDKLRDRLKTENAELGLNGVFAQRPVEFHRTELGETGTQHKAFVSTEFGHFWVDAERGKVNFVKPNGSGLIAISDFKNGGKESGMRKWFKTYLPFQITKVEGLDYLNIDNAYKDVGIVMWWDSKFKRVFITKKDYKPLSPFVKWRKDGGFYIDEYAKNNITPEPYCQKGYSYNPETKMCERFVDTNPTCPQGYVYNEVDDTCVKKGATTCPDGFKLVDTENGPVCIGEAGEVENPSGNTDIVPTVVVPATCIGTRVGKKCRIKEQVPPKYVKWETPVHVTNKEYFKDVSWTLAYSPIYDSWVSYYDFKPNYAIAYPNYFQTGLNYSNDDTELGVWSHLLTNKSFQVFYGKFYDWTIEYPIKNEYVNKVLESVSIWGRSYRYHNAIDYAEYRKKLFNEAIIYNHTNNSGRLLLDYVDNLNFRGYPKPVDAVSQIITAVDYDEQLKFNYFFNRTLKEDSHMPVWIHDDVNIEKELNEKGLRMGGKKVLERMRGDWFLVRLKQNQTSQLKHVFKWQTAQVNMY